MSATGLSPSELTALAAAEPPIQPQGLAKVINILSIVFLVLATIVIILRIFVRGWVLRSNNGWGHDDTLAILGFVRTHFIPPFTSPYIVS